MNVSPNATRVRVCPLWKPSVAVSSSHHGIFLHSFIIRWLEPAASLTLSLSQFQPFITGSRPGESATELFTLKWLIVYHVNVTSIKKKSPTSRKIILPYSFFPGRGGVGNGVVTAACRYMIHKLMGTKISLPFFLLFSHVLLRGIDCEMDWSHFRPKRKGKKSIVT